MQVTQSLRNIVVQTAVNGLYDPEQQTLTLHRVNTVAPAPNLRWSSVRTQAFTHTFDRVFEDGESLTFATLVGHDASGDNRRSHHLVCLASPSFVQSSNTITYQVELVNPQSPPPKKLDRIFLFFSHGQPWPVSDPEPLAEISELAATQIQEAFSAQMTTGGSYNAANNRLSLRNVSHFLLVDRPFTESLHMEIADLAPQLEEAYSRVATKPTGVLSLNDDRGEQQILLRLEDVSYDTETDELHYSITALESSTAIPTQFGAATLAFPPVISFGRGWPAHSVCCDCNAGCSALWVLFAYCKTCVSPLGASKCCSSCKRPPTPGGSC